MKKITFEIYRLYLIFFTENIAGFNSEIGPSCKLMGFNSFGVNTKFIGSSIGFASYISNDSVIQNTKIGKYCSIGPYVKTIHGIHPTKKFVSTHPVFFSKEKVVGFTYTHKQLFKESPDKLNKNEPYTTQIGNDVWIGASVNIIEGVKIGDGCIIASGALINKDVEPYSIVGGVPAKLIRKRFEDDEVNFLMEFKWWEKPNHWIKENAFSFFDIENFKHTNQSE